MVFLCPIEQVSYLPLPSSGSPLLGLDMVFSYSWVIQVEDPHSVEVPPPSLIGKVFSCSWIRKVKLPNPEAVPPSMIDFLSVSVSSR